MYGQIHIIIRQMVIAKYGHEKWDAILQKSGLDDAKHFLVFSQYDDSLAYKVVGAVSECLDMPVETVLEVFGDYFLIHVQRHGYDKMLKTLGNNMFNFIQNLDSLHSLLALSYKHIIPPSFRCETCENGDLLLHYYSVRPGLHPLVLGVVRAVGRDIFNQRVDIKALETTSEEIAGKVQHHTKFLIKLYEAQTDPTNKEEKEETRIAIVTEEETPAHAVCPMTSPFPLSLNQFCSMFPYHIIFNQRMIIKQCGYEIMKLSPLLRNPAVSMTDIFEVVHPHTTMTMENILKFINSVFFIGVKKDPDTETRYKGVNLKGQMRRLEDNEHMIFMGSLSLSSLNELVDMKVYMSDIPLYDVTRELVLLHEQRTAEIDYAQKLDETTAELKITSKALESEKKKTEMLLYQMLPKEVAQQLKNGKQVEAEKFEEVTILFSDIVKFTNISAACTPLEIVRMLNNLYQRFDQKTDEHGVYKVETIGDAYMIVCGVPEKTTYHSVPVARFAIDMIMEAEQVPSPQTGQPLQIRVGVHTGPVVAGVVGLKMPRYCLFGDTVNTASRMESHGLPSRIHVSPSTYQSLASSNFLFKEREEIVVKGKGKMTTYFLVGETSVIKEPNDDYINQPIISPSMVNMTLSPVSGQKLPAKSSGARVSSRACTVL